MKKVTALIMSLILILSLSACSSTNSENKATETTASKSENVQETTASGANGNQVKGEKISGVDEDRIKRIADFSWYWLTDKEGTINASDMSNENKLRLAFRYINGSSDNPEYDYSGSQIPAELMEKACKDIFGDSIKFKHESFSANWNDLRCK